MDYSQESSEEDEGGAEDDGGGGAHDECGVGAEDDDGDKVVEENLEEGRDGDDDFVDPVPKGRKEPNGGNDDCPPELKLQSPPLLGSFQSHVANYIWRGQERGILKNHVHITKLLTWCFDGVCEN
ncbi:hypothetical protein ACS0TY_032038 [Phlomoides rotata]